MSKLPSKVRLFTERDFREADRIERIYIGMMNPDRFQLNDQDEKYLNQLRTVFVTMSENLLTPESEAIRKIEILYPDQRRERIYQLMNDAENLFSRFRKVNKDHLRSLSRERIKKYIIMLERDEPKGYMDTIARFEALLIKLDGLDQGETVDTFDWSQLQLPEIQFTSNPKALAIEDAEYEEE